MWVKPLAVSKSPSSILHHGDSNQQRNPAVWFLGESTKLKVFSGTLADWNAGASPRRAHAPAAR